MLLRLGDHLPWSPKRPYDIGETTRKGERMNYLWWDCGDEVFPIGYAYADNLTEAVAEYLSAVGEERSA